MTVTRETLMAFVDGELSPEEERYVAAELARDPALNAYVEEQKNLAAKLASAFAPVLEEPVPARIEQAVREPQRCAASPVPLRLRLKRIWREQTSRAGGGFIPASAMAAGILLGVAIATSFGTGTEMRTEGGALIAQGTLARMLTAELASEQSADTSRTARIGVSFLSRDGAFCRSFRSETGARGATAGIACAEGGDWRIVALTEAERRDTSEFATASGEMPAMIRNALNGMISGDPLDAEQERAARDRGWAAR